MLPLLSLNSLPDLKASIGDPLKFMGPSINYVTPKLAILEIREKSNSNAWTDRRTYDNVICLAMRVISHTYRYPLKMNRVLTAKGV